MDKKSIKLAIVVPSIRPEAFAEWWRRWSPSLKYRMQFDIALIVVWDLPKCPFMRSIMSERGIEAPIGDNFYEMCWDDIKPEWKDVVHTKSDSVRNLGFLKAKELGVDYICTLDDDVYPIDNLWVDRMLHNLSRRVNPYVFNPAGFKTRGYPDKKEELLPASVLLHHCLWEGVPDVYAKDQLTYDVLDGGKNGVTTVPYGQLFPMCGMSLMFHIDLLPAMYFWSQEPIRRYGDIWCGLIAKKAIDLCGYACTSGSPNVYHSRMSDRVSSQKFEDAGAEVNFKLWQDVINIASVTPMRCIDYAVRHIVKCLPMEGIKRETGCQLDKWLDILLRIELLEKER